MSALFVIICAVAGFLTAAVFAGHFKLNRNLYLLIYIPVVAILSIVFFSSIQLDIISFITDGYNWGLLAAAVTTPFVVKNVLSQPASPRGKGLTLFTDIAWPGIFYGLADSLLLTIIPVLAVYYYFGYSIIFSSWLLKIAIGVIALLSSLLVTALYHWGYPEFRGKRVLGPVIGNGVMSLAFILSANPLAVILPHIAMHIGAMIHAKDTAIQVPPHYK